MSSMAALYIIASSPLKKGGGVEDFGSRDIGEGLALISGFWGEVK